MCTYLRKAITHFSNWKYVSPCNVYLNFMNVEQIKKKWCKSWQFSTCNTNEIGVSQKSDVSHDKIVLDMRVLVIQMKLE